MPKSIKITGDDPVWKRAVDEELARLARVIDNLQSQINYLKGRIK